MKYRQILAALDPKALYSPATIARFAEENGLFRGFNSKKERRLCYQRLRIAMGRFSNNHHFPSEGDGHIKLEGQPYIPGWFGWRWQQAAGLDSMPNGL